MNEREMSNENTVFNYIYIFMYIITRVEFQGRF